MKKRLIIVGGGHAGVEAFHIAHRRLRRHIDNDKIEVLLITGDPAMIGVMSCNPAIGGVGKGHLVKEIDALGGLMGRAIDRGGIQFRLLNQSRGPAVFGPRAQADRSLYKKAIQDLLQENACTHILQGQVKQILFDDKKITGVKLGDDTTIPCHAIILTTGTFLKGMIYIGKHHPESAGRIGEAAENNLSTSLLNLNLPLGRLKTGTPPRLKKSTIAWDDLPQQVGDKIPEPFSYRHDAITQPQITCAITHTNPATHDIIRQNLDESALYGGALSSIGPRYCPSIEDKVVKFADKTAHQIFLEPEGYEGNPDGGVVYPNGLSTSLPLPIQEQYIHSIKGLERAEILRAGYTVEYDFVHPQSLHHHLAVKNIAGLFLAGQINGTTGYEEAAAQGLVAGLNAAQFILGADPISFPRTESYIGVLVDDLTQRSNENGGLHEPYRMFTARAEHRLFLRPDNADARLTPLAIDLGLIDEKQQQLFHDKMTILASWRKKLTNDKKTPQGWHKLGISLNHDGKRRSGFDLLAMVYGEIYNKDKRSDNNNDIRKVLLNYYDGLADLPLSFLRTLTAESLYAGYWHRYEMEAKVFMKNQFLTIPSDIDYSGIAGLSAELVEKLSKIRPKNLHEATMINGMTPAGLYRLQAHLF